MLGKTEGSRKRGRPNMRWLNCTKKAIGVSLKEVSRAIEGRTLWTSLIRRIAKSQKWLDGT